MGLKDFPTDNTYKFLAFSGLAILIFVIVFIAPKRLEVEIDKERLKGKMTELDYEIKHIQKLPPDEQLAQSNKLYELGLKLIQLETTAKEISVRDTRSSSFFRLTRLVCSA
jgi:hypothetical protein